MTHLLDNPKLWQFLQCHIILNPLRDISFSPKVATPALIELKGGYYLAWSNFFSLFVPLLFLSSFHPGPRSKNQPISGGNGQFPGSQLVTLTSCMIFPQGQEKESRCPATLGNSAVPGSQVGTLACCVDVSPLYHLSSLNYKEDKWTLTKELLGWERSAPMVHV